MIKEDLSMMNIDIYTKAYEAGKQDVLSEVKLYKYVLYVDICEAMETLRSSYELSDDAYKKIMKQIDIIFDEENKNDTDSRYFRAGLVL